MSLDNRKITTDLNFAMTPETELLNELFEYNLHSNGALISSFAKMNGATPDKSVQLLNH